MPEHLENASWEAQPLPRGRHKLPAAEVHASQRARLIRAMLELVGTQGYDLTTVPQVVTAARVSSGTFYKHFADKPECFLAACDESSAGLLATLADVAGGERQGPEVLREGVRRYLRWWTDRPVFARAYFVELPCVGVRAAQQRDGQYALYRAFFGEIARRIRVDYPHLPPLTDAELSAAVFSPTELVAEKVRAGKTHALPELERDLYMLLLRLLTDDSLARGSG